MRKTVAAAAMAASLTVGGAAGAALFTPTLSSAQTDDTAETETDRPVATDRITEALAPLVSDGTITQDQADAVAAHLADELPLRHRHGFGVRAGFGEEVAEVLGLTTDELRTRLQGGESLADIAEAEGVDVQAVVDAIVAAHTERLDEAVADGHLTQEQADERAADLEEHAQDIVDGTFEGRMGGMRGPGGHRHGGMGMGMPGATDS
ncbi:MAG TPA: hypothetical protein VFV42_00970 [Acidimicrobiales bacterium]|nr:hypothetical protein [Acidimicrobiales bacterium]